MTGHRFGGPRRRPASAPDDQSLLGSRPLDPLTDEVLLARAYLSRVAEPPCAPLAALVDALGPVHAAECVRAGTVSEVIAGPTRARAATDRAEADLAALAARGGRLLVPESPDWPAFSFAGLDLAGHAAEGHAPLALWVRGPAAPVDTSRPYGLSVAVVGARAATDYGLWVARDWAAGLVDHGVRVVSGAALGIDGAAHRGALAAGGVTVAVLACGIDRPYPPTNATLVEHVAATGLIVTEYPPGTEPAKHRFLVRNRLVAALARGTLVVEAAARSGAHRTAVVAHELSRAVMVVPGPVSSALSVGCHVLARETGASVVGRVEDVVEDIDHVGDGLTPRPWSPSRPTDGLGPETLRVYEALPCRAARSAARLAQDSGVDPGRISTHLSELIAVGLAKQDESGYRRRPE